MLYKVRAKLIKSGVVEWFENCGCSIPLQHERETQYDYYFSEITTELVDESGKINGKSFWSYMEKMENPDKEYLLKKYNS